MTNKEWLDYLAHNAPDELAAWFDAEHVEIANGTLEATTAALDAKVRVGSSEVLVDSREKLEADAINLAKGIYNMGFNYANGNRELQYIAWQERDVIELLDRQAAITEREYGERMASEAMCSNVCAVVCEQRGRIAELQAKVDELTRVAESKRLSFADRIRFVNEIDKLTAERDELQAALNDICANLSIIATGEPNVIADIAIETIDELIDQCDEYRSKFGKCIDYADAIHALMDDEGMA